LSKRAQLEADDDDELEADDDDAPFPRATASAAALTAGFSLASPRCSLAA